MMSTPSHSFVRTPQHHHGPPVTSTPTSGAPAASQVVSEGIENAGRLIDNHLKEDAAFMELSGQLRIATHTMTNASGHADIDYPSLSTLLPSLGTLPSLGPHHHTPLPPELLQEFQNLQCNCAMGLMPEVSRAWLTIDNTIYMWNYQDGKDLAYFDGLDQVIMSVGLVRPREGVFQEHIQYLLCLTTAVEVVILGVSFTSTTLDEFSEMHLQPDPLFHLPSDNVGMVCVEGTPEGRLFLGGKDGELYEVTYQAKEGWFSKKCQLVNHSLSRLAFLVPSFLSFTEEDPLMQLVVDSSRQILYSRSNTNTITVYDLGGNGLGMSKVTSMSMAEIAHRAAVSLHSSDKSLFKPLISISVIPTSDSSTLHLLAVSQAGLRFYFTTTPNGVVGRPSLLALVHVRLPPGFSPSSAAHRPGNTVHQSFYRKGTLVMAASQSPEKDVLWIIDSDLFPFQSSLLESHVNISLEGRTWAIAESILPGELAAISSSTSLPPSVVTQHAHPPRQFILVSTQGSYLINKQRPVDQLQYLLEVAKGGTTEAIKAFFKLYKEPQACAMCLILATGANYQVSQWATEAFFKFGGDPQMTTPPHGGPSMQHQQVGRVSPMQTSPGAMGSGVHGQYHSTQTPPTTTPTQYGAQTPNFGMTLGWAVMGPEVQLSGKHNGLCRYLARLLRPLWNEHIVCSNHPTRSQPEEQFYSRHSFEELAVFLEQVYNFKAFFERNPQLLSPPLERSTTESPSNVTNHLFRHGNVTLDSPANPEQSNLQKQQTEANFQEYDSTRFLYQLVVRCFECLSLWKIICEYQLHLTVCGLNKETRERLKYVTFRFLILSGKEITSALICSLLARHAGDAVVSNSLSARLRENTPSLFSADDAVINKANELVAIAAASQTKYEQLNYLRQSLQHYCQVTLQLDLQSVAHSYQSLNYVEGVVELCLCAAQHKDPQNHGLHFYKSGQPSDDSAGQKAFLDRQSCYGNITNALSALLDKDRAPTTPYLLPTRPGPPSPQLEEEQDSPRKQVGLVLFDASEAQECSEFDEMVAMALRAEDELFHVSLYSWFLSVNLSEKLVEIKTPFIENYLKYTAVIQQDNRGILDLLWRYYKRNSNYSAAAKILDQLAHREGSELSLDDRIEYISRAVVSAKSSNLPTTSSQEGEVLHELEEKMEVARIQLNILDSLKQYGGGGNSMEVSNAITQLNSELMDITSLYEHFADKFDLAECKLAIVHCAGHYDPTLIESLWRDIVDNELRASASSSTKSQFENVRSKLTSLGCVYGGSERFFPVKYLAMMLEEHACARGWEVDGVHRTLREIGVTMVTLFKIYDKMFKFKDPFWESKGRPLHLLAVINSILLDYIQVPTLVNAYERPSFNAFVLDAISHYLIELQTLPPSTGSHGDVTTSLRTLQNSIQKLCSSIH